jgi:hypothetical protein
MGRRPSQARAMRDLNPRILDLKAGAHFLTSADA